MVEPEGPWPWWYLALWALALSVLWGTASCAGPKLPVEDDHLRMLNKVAGSYPNEIGACLAPDSLTIPYTRYAGRDGLAPSPCKEGVTVWWHAHPEELIYEPTDRYRTYVEKHVPHDFDPGGAKNLCYLSGADVGAIIEASYRLDSLAYAVVGVSPGTWCWWTVEQVRAAGRGTRFLQPPEGQVSWADG